MTIFEFFILTTKVTLIVVQLYKSIIRPTLSFDRLLIINCTTAYTVYVVIFINHNFSTSEVLAVDALLFLFLILTFKSLLKKNKLI